MCNVCNRVFSSYLGLNGHKNAHKQQRDEQLRQTRIQQALSQSQSQHAQNPNVIRQNFSGYLIVFLPNILNLIIFNVKTE